MYNRKYQVFISSTYEDLKDERAAVMQRIIDYGHIPLGMELFPTNDRDPLKYIKKVIDQADYYILIIGGRYGSTDNTNVSYTEQEFHYARKKNIPIFIFCHDKISILPAAKQEASFEQRKKLQRFKERLEKTYKLIYWQMTLDLAGQVFVQLSKAITYDMRPVLKKLHPYHDEELKKQISQLTLDKNLLLRLNDKYLKKLQKYTKLKIFHLANDPLQIKGTLEYPNGKKVNNWEMQTTWHKLFLIWAPRLISWKDSSSAIHELNTAILGSTKPDLRFSVHEYIFHAIKFKLFSCGMLEVNTFTDMLKISEEGEQYLREHLKVNI